MKIITAFCRVLVATTVVGVWIALAATNITAQTNDYLVKIRGIQEIDLGKDKITEVNLTDPPHIVVLRIIKNPPRQIQLQLRDESTNNVVAILVSSFRQAFLANGKFSSDLEQADPSFGPDGDLQIQGQETPAANPKKVKAVLIGVLNDSLNDPNGKEDAIFKGTLTGTRIP